jgi:Xaa-Pro aminopeptidase
MRSKKDKDEVAYIRKAARILDYAYKVGKEIVQPGISEADVYREVNSELSRRFEPTTAASGNYLSGGRSLKLGYPARNPSERKFRTGDTLLLDLQTQVEHYWGDTARTFVVGRPSSKQKDALRLLISAKKIAEKVLEPGVKGRVVYDALTKEILNANYPDLPHHGGHGLGLECQEPPFILRESDGELQEGSVCAIELGVYRGNTGGIRIEDDYVVTDSGFEKLSRFPLETF